MSVLELEAELVEKYGYSMSSKQVMEILKIGDNRTLNKRLEGKITKGIGGYSTKRLAELIYGGE